MNMRKVDAWAKHLLKQIQNYTKIEKSEPLHQNITGNGYENYMYTYRMIKGGGKAPQDDLHEAGQATEFSVVVPPFSAGSPAATATATEGVSAVIRRMEVRVWMAPHLLAGNVLLPGLVPDPIGDAGHLQNLHIQSAL